MLFQAVISYHFNLAIQAFNLDALTRRKSYACTKQVAL